MSNTQALEAARCAFVNMHTVSKQTPHNPMWALIAIQLFDCIRLLDPDEGAEYCKREWPEMAHFFVGNGRTGT